MKEPKKVVKVSEVLDEITAKKNDKGETIYNRFSKKMFNKLLKAMLNDAEFKTTVANVKKNNLESVDEIAVSQGFREFIRKVLEKVGIDAAESKVVLSNDFTFDDVDGLYEFFATAIYLFIEKGNRFDLLPKEDFKGSIYLMDVDETITISDAKSPQTHEPLGTFQITKKKHKKLGVKSSCPAYLKDRKQVNK